jgi:hypothetical protein
MLKGTTQATALQRLFATSYSPTEKKYGLEALLFAPHVFTSLNVISVMDIPLLLHSSSIFLLFLISLSLSLDELGSWNYGSYRNPAELFGLWTRPSEGFKWVFLFDM